MAEDKPTTEDVDVTEGQDTPSDTENEGSSKSETDWKAIAETERERAEKLQKKLAEDAFKGRKAKREDVDDTDDDDDDSQDRPLTAKDLNKFEERIVQRTTKELQERQALELIRANTTSDDHAQAVFQHWKNRVVPTGNLEEDVMFALGGVNYRSIAAKNDELARALRGKQGASQDASGTYRDAPEGSAPKLPALDAAAYKRAGFEYDTKLKVYKKKLPNGKFLIKDPKTKQTRIA